LAICWIASMTLDRTDMAGSLLLSFVFRRLLMTASLGRLFTRQK